MQDAAMSSTDPGRARDGSTPQKDSIFEPRKRACNACREKKVRCNQESPACQNCLIWKVPCTYSEKRKRAGQNVVVSKSLEDVDGRLSRMEENLLQLTCLLRGHAENAEYPHRKGKPPFNLRQPVASVPPEGEMSAPPPALITDENGKTHHVGVNSLLSMVLEAERSIKSRASTVSPPLNGGGTNQIVLNLADRDKSQLLTDDTFGESPIEDSVPSIPFRENEAVRICKLYFDLVNKFVPLFDEENFFLRLQKTYRDPATLKNRAWFVCLNNVLVFGMCTETQGQKGHPQTPMVDQCASAAWKTLGSALCWPSSLLKVQALVTAAYISQEISRPGLVWSLISFATREAQVIGLQRDCDKNSSLSASEKRDRKIAFWGLYVIDKNMSLTFGRAFSLPDFDIDVGYPTECSCIIWPSLEAWIKLAEIQGTIFQELYSAKALKLDISTRHEIAQRLDRQVRIWWADSGLNAFLGCDDSGQSQLEFAKLELKFNYHSTLVMIHRIYQVSPALGEDSRRVCLVEARNAITAIKTAIAEHPGLAENPMILWLVLFYPFASFFAIFSNVIERPAASTVSGDLNLMEFIVALLGQANSRSPGPERLYRVSKVFLDVAKLVTNMSQDTTTSTKRKRGESNASQHDQRCEGPQLTDADFAPQPYQKDNSSNIIPWQIQLPQPFLLSQAPAHALGNDSPNIGEGPDLHRVDPENIGIDHTQQVTDLDWIMWDQVSGWPGSLDDEFLGFY